MKRNVQVGIKKPHYVFTCGVWFVTRTDMQLINCGILRDGKFWSKHKGLPNDN